MEKKSLTPLNVLIIDDHRMVRDGLRIMLSSLKREMPFRISEADSGEEAIKKITYNHYDIVFIDYQMPGISGAETIYRILRFKPEMKILALSSYDEFAYVQSMTDAGAKGYILKDIERTEMLHAINKVLSGGIYYCNKIALKVIESKEAINTKKKKIHSILTRREIEILKWIALGCSNDEIADKLSVSRRTIDSHRQNLHIKLNAKNTAGLVRAAFEMKLMDD